MKYNCNYNERLEEDLYELEDIVEDDPMLAPYKSHIIYGYKNYFYIKTVRHKDYCSPESFCRTIYANCKLFMDEFGYDEETAASIASKSAYSLSGEVMSRLIVLEYYGVLDEILTKYPRKVLGDHKLIYSRIKYNLEQNGNDRSKIVSHQVTVCENEFYKMHNLHNKDLLEKYPLSDEKMKLFISKHKLLKTIRERQKENSTKRADSEQTKKKIMA